MPENESSTNSYATESGGDGKKKLVALVAGVAALLAVIIALAVPSCAKKGGTSASRVVEDVPDLQEEELKRPESGPLAKGDISVVNAEELYVRIADEGLAQAFENDAKNLTVKVSIAALDGSDKVWSKTYAGNDLKDSGSWVNDGTEVGIVLDSLRGGLSLADQADDDNVKLASVIAPGSDMLVYACALYGEGGIDNGEGEQVNSLFASLQDEDGRTYAVVSNLRHLANLDASRAKDGSYNSVRLGADISFDGGAWDDPASVSPAARQDGRAVRAIAHLAPITLVGDANKPEALVDGQGHVLRGLVIGDQDNPANNTGLFNRLGCEVANMTIANAQVVGADKTGTLVGELVEGANVHDCTVTIEPDADGAYRYENYQVRGNSSVGGLAGFATAATIRSCVSSVSVIGTVNVGGLVGEAWRGSIAESGARAAFVGDEGDTLAPEVSGNISVGGLVGFANGVVAIERSYAAVSVLSHVDDQIVDGSHTEGWNGIVSERLGGLVGTLENGTEVRNCYATGSVRGQTTAGGLVGSATNSNMRACFATGNVSANALGGGFVGDMVGEGVIESSRSYGMVTNIVGTPVATNGGFFGRNQSEGDNINDTNAYLREGGYNDVVAADANKNDGHSYGRGKSSYELVVDDGSIVLASKLHPYSGAIKGEVFPYEDSAGLGEIWGDWPVTRMGRWYRDDGELITERVVPMGSEPLFLDSLRAAERPQDYYADRGPYYLFVAWDGHYEDNGDYAATARVMELPFHEFFPDEPTAQWAVALRDKLVELVEEDWTAIDDFVIDSQAPDSPANPEKFSYQISAKKGQTPIMLIGQKLPSADQASGSYRVLRFDIGKNTLQTGFVTAKNAEQGGTHYYAYDAFTSDPDPES